MDRITRRSAILLVAFLVAGCVVDGPTNEPRISNETESTVSIFWANEWDEAYYRDIAPGQGAWVVSYGATCTPNGMVAKTADGRVIARTGKPLCPGDVWVLEPPGPSPSADVPGESMAPSTAPAGSQPMGSVWGPLAIVPPQDGADSARTEGTLQITASCVVLAGPGGPTILVWPADRTVWEAAERSVRFVNFDGSTVIAGDGAHVAVGGSGDSFEESGSTNEEWLTRTQWVAPPHASCPLDKRWWVGGLER